MNSKYYKEIPLRIGLTLLSIIIGGWVSKDLFFTSQEGNVAPKKTFSRMLMLIVLSLVVLGGHLIVDYFFVQYTSELHKEDSPIFDLFFILILIGFVCFLLFTLLCIYKSFRNLIKYDWFIAIQWLLPLTAVLFNMTLGSKYWNEIQYWKASSEFHSKEKYYNAEVAKAPNDKNGLPKLVVFNKESDDQGETLLVYDESDDLDNIHSNHRRMFEVEDQNRDYGTVPHHNVDITIFQTKVLKIQNHFYLVFVEYAGTPQGNIFIK